LNFRDLATAVGIKAASIHYHFPSKASLGAAVARRYWEDTAAELDAMSNGSVNQDNGLSQYPDIFRRSLESGNRMCLCSFMAAEYDDLPDAVKTEVQTFTDINVAWLKKALAAKGSGNSERMNSVRVQSSPLSLARSWWREAARTSLSTML
jgi:TetR/AcrR family transcriptional repressor of nem operon